MMPVKSGWETDLRTMMPGAIFSTGLNSLVSIGPLPSTGRPERVDRAAEQGLADRHGEQATGRGDFVTLLQQGNVAQNDAADFVLFQIERDPNGAAREPAPSRCTSRPRGRRSWRRRRRRSGCCRCSSGPLWSKAWRFVVRFVRGQCSTQIGALKIGTEKEEGLGLNGFGQSGELAGDGGFVNIVAEVHPQAGEQRGIGAAHGRHGTAIFLGPRGRPRCLGGPPRKSPRRARRWLRCAPVRWRSGDDRPAGPSRDWASDVFQHTPKDAADLFGRDVSIRHAQLEKHAGELVGGFGVGGHFKRWSVRGPRHHCTGCDRRRSAPWRAHAGSWRPPGGRSRCGLRRASCSFRARSRPAPW